MCLICVEFHLKRMTKDEVKKALPEMIMFAKNEEERNHFKKLQSFENLEELEEETKRFASQSAQLDDNKSSFKTRRS